VIVSVIVPRCPGASVSRLNPGAFGSTVCCQTSPVEELVFRSNPSVCAIIAVLTVAFGAPASPNGPPAGVGAMSQSPGDASRVRNVAEAELPALIAGRSGSPKPKSNVTGSDAWATASTWLVSVGIRYSGGVVPDGSGNARPVSGVSDSSAR
jgi:hypothetical protein